MQPSGLTALAVVSLSDSQRGFDNFVSDEFSRGSLARDVRAAASARAVSARNLILLNGPEDVAAETIAVKAAHARVQERVAVLKRKIQDAPGVSDTERDIFTRLEAIEASYGAVAMSIVAKSLAGDKEAAIAQMNAECQPLLKQLIGSA